MSEPLSEAKQTLLSALDSIEEAEEDIGAEVRHVCVVYSVCKRDEDGRIYSSGGWNHSDDPDWLIAAMLRHCADAIEDQPSLTEED